MLNGIFTSIGTLDVSQGFLNPLTVLWQVIVSIFSSVVSFKWWIFVFIGSDKSQCTVVGLLRTRMEI